MPGGGETATIVSAARSLTCRDDLDSKWRLLLAEKELSCLRNRSVHNIFDGFAFCHNTLRAWQRYAK